jgi:hypothetical protein
MKLYKSHDVTFNELTDIYVTKYCITLPPVDKIRI